MMVVLFCFIHKPAYESFRPQQQQKPGFFERACRVFSGLDVDSVELPDEDYPDQDPKGTFASYHASNGSFEESTGGASIGAFVVAGRQGVQWPRTAPVERYALLVTASSACWCSWHWGAGRGTTTIVYPKAETPREEASHGERRSKVGVYEQLFFTHFDSGTFLPDFMSHHSTSIRFFCSV